MKFTTAETIARGLEAAHRSGEGWTARRPAHDDNNPSLFILTTASAISHLPAIKARIGLSRYTFHARMEEGRFPKPVALGGRAVGWVESEVDDWLTRQIQSSREAQSLRHKSCRPQP